MVELKGVGGKGRRSLVVAIGKAQLAAASVERLKKSRDRDKDETRQRSGRTQGDTEDHNESMARILSR